MTSTAVAKKGPDELIETYGEHFATVLPSHLTQESWLRLALGVMRKSPELRQAAERDPGSLVVALMECARLGHEPGTKSFYLVPIGGKVEGWEGYRGVIDRMFRGGAVTSVKVEIVREGDKFRYDPGTMNRPEHEVDWFGGDRGQIIGAYAYAELVGGATSRVVVIDRDYIAKVKKEAKGSGNASSPWQKWDEAMVLKTAAHRLEPWVPTSAEYRNQSVRTEAAAVEVALPAGDVPDLPDPVTPPSDDEVADAVEVCSDCRTELTENLTCPKCEGDR